MHDAYTFRDITFPMITQQSLEKEIQDIRDQIGSDSKIWPTQLLHLKTKKELLLTHMKLNGKYAVFHTPYDYDKICPFKGGDKVIVAAGSIVHGGQKSKHSGKYLHLTLQATRVTIGSITVSNGGVLGNAIHWSGSGGYWKKTDMENCSPVCGWPEWEQIMRERGQKW